jgi:hypothetical protein
MAETEQAGVVDIGGGSDAHESAVAAKHYGAERVIMLEKAPESQSGGNARFSGTGFRRAFDWAFDWAFDDIEELREVTDTSPEEFASVVVKPYTAQMFTADLNRVAQGRMNPEMVDVHGEGKVTAVDGDFGVRSRASAIIDIQNGAHTYHLEARGRRIDAVVTQHDGRRQLSAPDGQGGPDALRGRPATAATEGAAQ